MSGGAEGADRRVPPVRPAADQNASQAKSATHRVVAYVSIWPGALVRLPTWDRKTRIELERTLSNSVQ